MPCHAPPTAVADIVRLVEAAQSRTAPVQRFADVVAVSWAGLAGCLLAAPIAGLKLVCRTQLDQQDFLTAKLGVLLMANICRTPAWLSWLPMPALS